MAAMFRAMVWHAQRRWSATEERRRVSLERTCVCSNVSMQFIQDASHELRTPITVALGHAELVERASERPAIAEDARRWSPMNLTRLRRLADRSYYWRLSRARLPTRYRSTWAAWSSRPSIDGPPTARRWGLDSVEPIHRGGRRRSSRVALDAVVENAVKHTGNGHDRDRLQRSGTGRPCGSAAGHRHASRELERIFDRFARSSRVGAGDPGGVGLGLAIVKAIVQAHGGSVARRRAPKGSGTAASRSGYPSIGDPVIPVTDDVVMVEGVRVIPCR